MLGAGDLARSQQARDQGHPARKSYSHRGIPSRYSMPAGRDRPLQSANCEYLERSAKFVEISKAQFADAASQTMGVRGGSSQNAIQRVDPAASSASSSLLRSRGCSPSYFCVTGSFSSASTASSTFTAAAVPTFRRGRGRRPGG